MWTLTNEVLSAQDPTPAGILGQMENSHKCAHTACIAEESGCFERPGSEICWLQYRLSFGGSHESVHSPLVLFSPETPATNQIPFTQAGEHQNLEELDLRPVSMYRQFKTHHPCGKAKQF